MCDTIDVEIIVGLEEGIISNVEVTAVDVDVAIDACTCGDKGEVACGDVRGLVDLGVACAIRLTLLCADGGLYAGVA